MKTSVYTVLCLGALFYSTSCSSTKKSYSATCLNGKTVTVDASSVGRTSTYKTYKQLVCKACAVQRCEDTRLFKGYSKKDDNSRILTSSLQGLQLKSYGSTQAKVSYRCPDTETLRTAQCQTAQTLKECLVKLCQECSSTNCEVYAGSTKVSSGKVAVAKGVYRIDTKASTAEKLKKKLEAVKKIATSDKAKGAAKAIGAAVVSNKDVILKFAKSIGVPEEKLATMQQIIKVGNSLYAKDLNGGLVALAELTGHPLSEEEEKTIENDMSQDEEVEYASVLAVLKEESARVESGQDLYEENKDSFLARYGLYIAVSVVLIVVIACCVCCVLCCRMCLRKKKRVNVDYNLQQHNP
ncbi:lysyl oxidase-like protein 2/3/4 [Sarotherodon galilaeus]